MKVFLCYTDSDTYDGIDFEYVVKVVATEQQAWAWLRELAEPKESVFDPRIGLDDKCVGIERYCSRWRDKDGEWIIRTVRVFEVES